ncbi:MAG: lipid A deacylase LpxR family protein [Chitinophagaceae bacterium]
MTNKTGLLLIILLTSCLGLQAQLIDPTTTFRNVSAKSYFRFHYDNDYFTKTDYYYSQGITLEYVHPKLAKFPLSRLLFKTPNSNKTYGICFNLFGYTPINTDSDSILYGDRPFSSALSISYFSNSTDTIRKYRVSSTLQVGIFGPLALGERLQTNIHRWLNNKLPKGWQYQVANDVILNYQLNFEKRLIGYKDRLLLNGIAQANFGTLQTKAGAGINFMAGYFNDPYQSIKHTKKKIEFYTYGQARLHVVGYDAMLQGGIFNKKSPYVIRSGHLSRTVFEFDGGIAVNYKKLLLTYSRSYIGKEFSTGKDHTWGGISIGYSF